MAIEKSYIDMLKERDAKIEALKELLKLAHESLDSKDKQIADLEKENKHLDDCFDECYAELGKVQYELNK